jgi:hypothetical protein
VFLADDHVVCIAVAHYVLPRRLDRLVFQPQPISKGYFLNMTINLKLQYGIGHLVLNTDDAPAAAELNGWIDFIVDPKNDQVRVRLDLKVWIKLRSESEPWYALSCLGWTGVLRKQPDQAKADGPHYVGHLGPNEELQVSGWKCVDDDGEHYITLEVRDAAMSPETKSPGDDNSVDLDPDLKRIVF